MFIGLVVVVTVLTRTTDLKKRFIAQVAVPHGIGGRLMAWIMPMAHDRFYGPAAELLELGPTDHLVEVACGSGAFISRHAGDIDRVAGIDLSPVQVDLARRRLGERIAAGTAEIVEGDAVALPWDDDSFTAAACIGSMEYIADPPAVLREMVRVLRPGGRVVVSWGADESDPKSVAELESLGIPHPPEEETRKALEEAGFSLVSISYDRGTRYLHGVKPE
jgi:SAM-dependent methyltransferase